MNDLALLEILRDQQLELRRYESMHFCPRKAESKINLKSKLAQIVIGVRRSGKSVLCYNALSKSGVNYAYVNFDDERLVKLKTEELNDVLRCLYQVYGNFTHLFIDEAQNIDGWHLFVNRLLRQGLRVIITGSNAKLLSSELATHLTGRYHEIELYPLSFGEYCELTGVETHSGTTQADGLLRAAFDTYLKIGGFPEIDLGEEEADEYIDRLVYNVLHRDIIQRFKVKYKDAFVRLANHIMNISPCLINIKALAEAFNFKSVHTAENYIDYLYQAYLTLQLQKYSPKSMERVRNTKAYTVDVALMNARKDALAKENLGWRLETIVYIELLRRYGSTHDIYYYTTPGGSAETDFVVCHGAEVKKILQVSYDISSPKTLAREIKGLTEAAKATRCSDMLLITAYENGIADSTAGPIKIVSAYKWLLEDSLD